MDDDKFYKNVLSACYRQIVEDLEPETILDEMIVEDFLPTVAIRDIRDQPTISAKNRLIVQRVMSRGPEGYRIFLKLLERSRNEHLKDIIQSKASELAGSRGSGQRQIGGGQQKYNAGRNQPAPQQVAVPVQPHKSQLKAEPHLDAPCDALLLPLSSGPISKPQQPQRQQPQPQQQPAPFQPPPYQPQQPPPLHQDDIGISFSHQPESAPSTDNGMDQSGQNSRYLQYKQAYGQRYMQPAVSAAAYGKTKYHKGPSIEDVPRGRLPDNEPLGESNEPPSRAISEMSLEDEGRSSEVPSPPELQVRATLQGDDVDHAGMPSSLSSVFRSVKHTVTIEPTFDGRILERKPEEFEEWIKGKKKLDAGGYGDVYDLKDNQVGHFVVKKIKYKDDAGKLRSGVCEMLAARLMHFAIVPLLSMADDKKKGIFYFMFPYMENGCLAAKLKADKDKITTREKAELTMGRRKCILTQIASAMEFLHTKVRGFRRIYVHGDITTRNIVLDRSYNARLIDFGLAREYTAGSEGVTMKPSDLLGTPGYFQSSQRKRMTVKTDLFNFGVVILEVLTSAYALDGKNRRLYDFSNLDHLYDDYEEFIQAIWGMERKTVDPYLNVAGKCLKEMASTNEIVETLKGQCENKFWEDPQQDTREKRCVVCLINPVCGEASQILAHKDRCPLHVCVSCMRNSYLNPLQCPSCLEKVEPPIGNNWAAILIAGNDPKNKEKANTFFDDMQSVKKAIISRHPLTIGISEDHVYCVSASKPGEVSTLLPDVRKHFTEAAAIGNVHTLFFYFSGHHGTESGFQLGSEDEFLSVEEFKELVKSQRDTIPFQRVIVLLDCCYAPLLSIRNLHLPVAYYQLNSCCQNQDSPIPFGEGSPFTAFVLKCLKGKSSDEKCLVAKRNEKKVCKICDDFNSSGGFILMDDLKRFVGDHIKEYNKARSKNHTVTFYCDNDNSKSNLAFSYFIYTLVEYAFQLEMTISEPSDKPRELKTKMRIPKLPEKLQELKIKLFKEFQEKLQFPHMGEEFADILAIKIRDGPKGYHFQELCSVGQLEAAWNGKRELYVHLRSVEHLKNGKVGFLLSVEKAEDIRKYLEDEKVKSTNIAEYYPRDKVFQVIIALEDSGVRNIWKLLKDDIQHSPTCSSFTHIKETLNTVKSDKSIEQKGKLVISFPLKENGELIQNFYAVHIQTDDDDREASFC